MEKCKTILEFARQENVYVENTLDKHYIGGIVILKSIGNTVRLLIYLSRQKLRPTLFQSTLDELYVFLLSNLVTTGLFFPIYLLKY